MTEVTSLTGGVVASRRAPKGLLPSTWEGHELSIEYKTGDGHAATMIGVKLVELYPFGPDLIKNGTRTALSWEAITLVELA